MHHICTCLQKRSVDKQYLVFIIQDLEIAIPLIMWGNVNETFLHTLEQ